MQVKVEVVHNAFDDKKENDTSFFKERDDTAMQKTRAYLYHLHHGTKHVQKELKDAGEVVEHGVREVAKEASHVISPCERAVQCDADTEGKLLGKSNGDICAVLTVAQHEDHKRPQLAGANMASECRDAKPSRKGHRQALSAKVNLLVLAPTNH